MHLAEGTLPLTQALAWSAIALPLLAWSVRGEVLEQREPGRNAIVISGCTSLLFAATLFPLPVPVVGATSHICLTPLVALLLGVRRTIWPTFFILLLQALFFAHGGLTTLGINMLTLGVIGPLVAVLIYQGAKGLSLPFTWAVALACCFADLSVYAADAGVLALGLSNVAAPSTTFVGVLLGFLPVQLPLAIAEGFVSMTIFRTLQKRRPDLLAQAHPKRKKAMRVTAPTTLLLLLCLLFVGGCSYEGIDASVFGVIAERSGQAPTPTLLDFSEGELGLGAQILVLFSMGMLFGRFWERLVGKREDAPTS